ncbi:phytoene/squalene synthase family protein [soil metagenome]
MSSADPNAAFTADLVRSHDFSRYASTLFVPPDKRRALLALYAFNVEITRVREQVSQPLPGEIRLQWWTDMLAGAGHGDVTGNPVAAELMWAIGRHQLPIDRLAKLIDTHIFDLYHDPMPDLTVLETHFADTTSTLLALAAKILGDTSEAAGQVADHGGLAQGVAQVIALLPYDSARGQLFLPLDILTQHGSSAAEVFLGKPTPAIRAALDQLIDGARAQLATAKSLLPQVSSEARRAFLPLALVAQQLDRMAMTETDPFAIHVPSRLRTLWTLWRASRSDVFS